MKKDLFIDTNVASRFSNPQDKEYIKLTGWLLHFKEDEDIQNFAHLVVSKKLLVEYLRSAREAKSDTSIPTIINELQIQGRLIIKKPEEIKDFRSKYYTKTIEKKFRSNAEDWDHFPLILLSDRKYALSMDDNFIYDLKNFPGYDVLIEKRPEKIPYNM